MLIGHVNRYLIRPYFVPSFLCVVQYLVYDEDHAIDLCSIE